MKKPTALLHVARPEMIEANARALADPHNDPVGPGISAELHFFTTRLLEQGWNCYWYLLQPGDVDPLHLRKVYEPATGRRLDLPLAQLNSTVDVIVPRVIGSVEGKLPLVRRYFSQLRDKFAGITINDPDSVLYGLRKDYLLEFLDAGVKTIATDYFPNTVSYAELADRYGHDLGARVIKPVTGELSNSLAVLADIDESTLRWKEPKVGGWLVQPVSSQVWGGEFQLFFIGDRCVNSQVKAYTQIADEIIPTQTSRECQSYAPLDSEIALAR